MLGMRPVVPGCIMLQPVLLVRERILEHLTRTHATDRELPARSTAVEGHKDILLHLTGDDVVQDDIAGCPAAGLEPG